MGSQASHTSTELKQSIAQAMSSKQNLRLALQDIVQLRRPRKEWFQVDVEKDDDEATSTTQANTTSAYKQLRTTTTFQPREDLSLAIGAVPSPKWLALLNLMIVMNAY